MAKKIDVVTQERLREYAKKKRGILLKDVDLVTLAQMIDRLLDEGIQLAQWQGIPMDDFGDMIRGGEADLGVPVAYLKYATQWQVQLLKERFPMAHLDISLAVPRNHDGPKRTVTVFESAMIEQLLTFLVTEPKKYFRTLTYSTSAYLRLPGYYIN